MINPYHQPDPILCACDKPAMDNAKRCVDHIHTIGFILYIRKNTHVPLCLYRPCDVRCDAQLPTQSDSIGYIGTSYELNTDYLCRYHRRMLEDYSGEYNKSGMPGMIPLTIEECLAEIKRMEQTIRHE